MGHWTLSFLGYPQVSHRNLPAKFPTRKSLALLCYLAVEAAPVSRARLMTLLWPDSDTKRGRTALRTTLTQLRDALSGGLNSPETFVLSEGDTLHLNPQWDVSIDTRMLEAGLVAAQHYARSGGRALEQRAALEQAVAAYRGDFLEGFSLSDAPEFDDWASLQRETQHRNLSRVFDQFSRLLLNGGEFAQGIEIAQRWVRHDALNESAHRRLIQLRMAIGDRSGALRAYQDCRTTLMSELNAEPSPETQTLADYARAQQPAPEQEEAGPGPGLTSSPRKLPLVGRAVEHTRLIDAYRSAQRGEPQMVVVTGMSGIGKTRLAREFSGWAVARGAAILRGKAFDMTFNQPYQVWIDALRQHLAQPGGQATVDGLEYPWQMQLARLVPELAQVAATAGQAASQAGEQGLPYAAAATESPIHLYEAVFRFTHALVQKRPLVILFDDMQWADTASLDMLQYVSYRWAEMQRPILVVATVRTDDLPALQERLDTLKKHLGVAVLALQPLAPEDTTRLVQSFIGQFDVTHGAAEPDTQRFATQIHQDTAGHPLFLVETLAALVENDAAPTPATARIGDIGDTLTRWQTRLQNWIAPGVAEIIQSRLLRLTAPSHKLLNALSVAGQDGSFDVCYQTAGLDEEEALSLLDELKARGIVRETTASGRLSFTHDKIREVVYAGLSSARRRALHRRAGDVLIQNTRDCQDECASVIAGHFDAAGDDRAIEYFQRAGEAATQVYAYVDAARYLDRAAALLRQWPLLATGAMAQARPRIIALYTTQAGVHTQLADYAGSAQACQELEAFGRAWGDDKLVLNMLLWRASQLAMPSAKTDLAEARRLTQESLPLAQALRLPHEEANARMTLSRVACWQADFAGAMQQGEAALEILRHSPERQMEAYALNDLALVCIFNDQLDAARQYQQRSLKHWRNLAKPSMLVHNLCMAMLLATRHGCYTETLAYFDEAQAICERTASEWAHLNSIANAGMAHFELGMPERALALMEEAVQGARRHHLVLLMILAGVDLADIYRALGMPERAKELLLEIDSLAHNALPAWRLLVLAALARLSVQQCALDEAREQIDAGCALLAGGLVLPMARIPFEMARAELALAEGRFQAALGHCQAVIADCRERDVRHPLPQALLLYGRALRAQGDSQAALDALNEARAEAEEMGAQWRLRHIVSELAGFEAHTKPNG